MMNDNNENISHFQCLLGHEVLQNCLPQNYMATLKANHRGHFNMSWIQMFGHKFRLLAYDNQRRRNLKFMCKLFVSLRAPLSTS